jgi:hypothetical protein
VGLLAYNLILSLMAQAALDAGVHPRQLIFKHTVQLWTEWTAHRVHLSTDPDTLFRLIAQSTVGNRPGRIEPRARKRRPKPYPWLKRRGPRLVNECADMDICSVTRSCKCHSP